MSLSVAIGVSNNKDAYLAGKEAAYNAYQNLAANKISIAFVFATAHFNPQRLLQGIKETLGDTSVVGTSGAGIISPTGIDVRGVVVLAAHSEKIKFITACQSGLDRKDLRAAGQQLGQQALKQLGHRPKEVFIAFIDGLINDTSGLIAGIEESLGRSFPIVGGSSADDLRFHKTYQFSDHQGLSNSAVGVLIGEEAKIKIGIRHGWKPIGKARRVTACAGNIIRSIDERPAISIYEDYFGKDNREIRADRLISLSIRYPLGIYLEGEEEYLLRNSLRAEEDGSLVCRGDIPPDSRLNLMMTTKESVLNATAQAAQEACGAGKDKPIQFALVFSSFSRSRLLGREAKKEIEIIKKTLGRKIPFAGFYTYGEQAPLTSLNYRGQSHFHNESIAIVGIGE